MRCSDRSDAQRVQRVKPAGPLLRRAVPLGYHMLSRFVDFRRRKHRSRRQAARQLFLIQCSPHKRAKHRDASTYAPAGTAARIAADASGRGGLACEPIGPMGRTFTTRRFRGCDEQRERVTNSKISWGQYNPVVRQPLLLRDAVSGAPRPRPDRLATACAVCATT